MTWPFPNPPIPWTAKQEREYQRKLKEQAEEAPL